MNVLLALGIAHPAAAGLIIYLILSALIGSMPKLPDNASYGARWAYGCLQILALNLKFAANFFKLPVPHDTTKDAQ